MDKKEIQLEQVAKAVEEYEIAKSPPIFEIYAALVAIGIAMLLFWVPNMLSGYTELYRIMTGVFTQSVWAVLFFIAGVFSALGMLFKADWLRIATLCVLASLYMVVALCYGLNFPNLGSIVFGALSLFCVFSIPIVKFTGLHL